MSPHRRPPSLARVARSVLRCRLASGHGVTPRPGIDRKGDMSATQTDERTAIEAAVQLYIDGSSTGDVSKLEEAFLESAWMYGSLAGQRYDVPIAELFSMVAATPLGSDSYSARIVSVDQIGDAAVVKLAEDGCWGTVSFVDWFSLVKVDGAWKIADKTFAHTGGEMPAG